MPPAARHPKTDPGSWARYRTTCTGCHVDFMFLYQFSDLSPTLETSVTCPSCGSPTPCAVPASAHDFVTRLLPPA